MSWRDPNFKYRRSEATDIRKTIAAEKKRLKEAVKKVTPIRKRAGQ